MMVVSPVSALPADYQSTSEPSCVQSFANEPAKTANHLCCEANASCVTSRNMLWTYLMTNAL